MQKILHLSFLALCFVHFSFAQEQFSYDLPAEKQQAISRKTVTMQLPQQSKASKIDVDVVGNTMFFEGDIAIQEQPKARALGIKGDYYRWANSVVPYTIAAGHPRVELIKKAIEHINAKTNICVVPRTNEADYIEFVNNDNGCWSYVGRIGGKQLVNVSVNCPFGSVVHEICHAIGMWHEHTRPDRDKFIRINWDNINQQNQHNYKLRDADLALGDYDYESIMHYGPYGFSINGQPTIVCTSNCNIGQRESLSRGDIAAINEMYPKAGCDNNNSNNTNTPAASIEVGVELTEKQKQAKISVQVGNFKQEKDFSKINYTARGFMPISIPREGKQNYTITVTFVDNSEKSRTISNTKEIWFEKESKYEVKWQTSATGEVVGVEIVENKTPTAMVKQGITIYNSSDKEIPFELSDDNAAWRKESLAAKSGKKYTFGKASQLFGYIRIPTQGKDFVYYRIVLPREYTLFWNDTRQRWDLFQQN